MAAMSSAELARGEGRIPSAWTRVPPARTLASPPCDSASVVPSPQTSLSSFMPRRFLVFLFYLLCTSYWFCYSAPVTLRFSEAHSDVWRLRRAGSNDAGPGGRGGGQDREEESAGEEDSSSEDSGEDDEDNEEAELNDDKKEEEAESTDDKEDQEAESVDDKEGEEAESTDDKEGEEAESTDDKEGEEAESTDDKEGEEAESTDDKEGEEAESSDDKEGEEAESSDDEEGEEAESTNDNEGEETESTNDKEGEETESTNDNARDFGGAPPVPASHAWNSLEARGTAYPHAGGDDSTRLTKDLERGRHRRSRFSSSDSRDSYRRAAHKVPRLRDEGGSRHGSRSKDRTGDESARRALQRGRSRSDGYGKDGYRERSKTRALSRRRSKLRSEKEQRVTPNREARSYARAVDEDASGSFRDHLQELASMFSRIGGADSDEDEDDEDLYSIRDEQEKVVVSYAEGFTVSAAGTMVGRRPTDEDAILVNAILPQMPNVRVKAIFDGHGGDEVSRYLADNALTYLSNLTSLRPRDIKAACQALDDAVRKHVWKRAPDAGSTGVIAFIEKVTKPVEVFVVGREIVPEDTDPRSFVPLVEQLRVDALAEGDTETALSLAALVYRYTAGRRSRRRKHRRKPKKIRLGKGEAVFRVVVANVGDSRAVLLHRDGSFTPLSRDQKPEQDTERLRVEAAGGRVFFGGVPRVDNMLAVARSFGDFYMKDNPRLPADKQKIIAVPDIRMFYATPKDYLLLTCDGVFESPTMTYKNVADVIYSVPAGDSVRGRMKHAVKALLDAAYETGSHDNISALLTAFTRRGRFSSHTTLGYSIYTGTGEVIQKGRERQENARVNPEKVKKNVALY
ncbi:protein phosphatase 2C domain-containing protein [Toxoplasma gondii ARI]|uniref:Protein phosphatase 2C domain-containing protein n=1 Tax=Toxoplasma gondii ARI TaxID=1074872 RepID=A0A139XZE1_TOXGO|nr:protein phosphatase 2C domain-containing protein [Toxoplasma gondii ARI]